MSKSGDAQVGDERIYEPLAVYRKRISVRTKRVKIILMDILQGSSIISSRVQRFPFNVEDGKPQ
jgi:hypothetical protein